MRPWIVVPVVLMLGCGTRPAAEPERPISTPIDAAPQAPIDRVLADIHQLDQQLASIRLRMAKHRPDIANLEWVKAKLRTMAALDQLVRKSAAPRAYSRAETLQYNQAVRARATEVDQDNTRSLKVLVKRHGWITIKRFGREASQNAWLLAQHADHDVPFQKAVLDLLLPLMQAGKVRPSDYAYLYDRVATAEGRPQRYGTQGRCVGKGQWKPGEIEDAINVDQRRGEVGLKPMAEYERDFISICR